jgi:hypothetical protein
MVVARARETVGSPALERFKGCPGGPRMQLLEPQFDNLRNCASDQLQSALETVGELERLLKRKIRQDLSTATSKSTPSWKPAAPWRRLELEGVRAH